MDSVQCGTDQKSAKSFAGEIIGTDDAHQKMHTVLCQEYLLQTDRIDLPYSPQGRQTPRPAARRRKGSVPHRERPHEASRRRSRRQRARLRSRLHDPARRDSNRRQPQIARSARTLLSATCDCLLYTAGLCPVPTVRSSRSSEPRQLLLANPGTLCPLFPSPRHRGEDRFTASPTKCSAFLPAHRRRRWNRACSTNARFTGTLASDPYHRPANSERNASCKTYIEVHQCPFPGF